MRSKTWAFVIFGVWALLGAAQIYRPGEIYYGGIRLEFSGQLLTGGACAASTQIAPNITQLHCQIPEGETIVLELRAIRTPAGAVNIRADALPSGWPAFPVVSGWGKVTAQYRFTLPKGSAGQSYELRFKAWAAGVVGELELRVIVEVLKTATPTEPTVFPTYGPFSGTTDGFGRFEVPIPILPGVTVTGTLTECTVRSLSNVVVFVSIVPKQVGTLRSVEDIAKVRVSSPGYGEVEVIELMLTSSSDISGRTYTTIHVGTICLRSGQELSAGQITGKTDAEGKFTVSLPFPGATVSGRLIDPFFRPIQNQPFTILLIPKGVTFPEEIAGFVIAVPGYVEATVTKFSKFVFFGLTNFLLGDVQLMSAELPWNADRPLTWDDFQGLPPAGAEKSAEAAQIVMRLGYSFKAQTWFDTKTGKWKAHLIEVTTTNAMDRTRSWVVPERKTDALLNHEQKHFDLNEVYRRLLQAALENFLGRLETVGDTEEEAMAKLEEKLKEMFERVKRKCEEVQNQYDQETEHGRNAEKQREWDKKIAEWLFDPTKAPQP